ncbi:hypothetical protein PN499_23675 [Kamptonema animale CS-326]|jgi:glycerol dehydrogenase-like iron-containing ADH family enzyme|uniref:hypothetical protein n=1 Tax=Kamptonema animale TaxID=92934 RepID=UPI002330BC54|nr:hypothetical protein [Kamptonema animale]MDB9514204.1 hypothetical protein [Kamptonema animale CS-326]
MTTNSREYTNINGDKVCEYKQNGQIVGRGTGKTSDSAKAAADADVQIRKDKK